LIKNKPIKQKFATSLQLNNKHSETLNTAKVKCRQTYKTSTSCHSTSVCYSHLKAEWRSSSVCYSQLKLTVAGSFSRASEINHGIHRKQE